MFLRYPNPKQEHSSNGLKNPTNDPSFPLPERSQTPFNPTLGVTANQYAGGNDFHQTMTETSRPGSPAAYNWLPGREDSSDDSVFNEFMNFEEDQPPHTAVKMTVGPSHSSGSSQSDSSSISSKRQKSNDGSARSSFSVTNTLGIRTANHGLRGNWLGGTGAPTASTDCQFASLSEMDSVNQMAYNLAVDSAENSPTDSLESNSAASNAIAAMAMPNDSSPSLSIDPAATTGSYAEASIDSSEVSPITMNWTQPTHAHPTKLLSPQNDTSNATHPQIFQPVPKIFDYSQWYHQSQPPSTATQKQKCQELIWLSQDPRPDRPSGRYFDLKSSRTGTRVETALDVRLILTDPPTGIMKLRVHEDHLTKVKHLKDRLTPLSSDALELRATVFCHTAMQTTNDIQNAMNRAVGREADTSGNSGQIKIENSPSSENSDYRPLEGDPVRICEGCVSREAKRLRRSKLKSEETDEWLFNASHRTLVFNNGQTVEWKFPHSTNAAEQLLAQPLPTHTAPDDEKDEDGKRRVARKLPPPPVEVGTIAVDLAMRICCYCRHQHESTGFRVVFTLTNHLGKVYGQQITRPIMITDDHKDKDKKDSAPPTPPGTAEGTQLPGHFTFQSGPTAPRFSANLQQSYSTPNLPAMAPGYGFMPSQHLATPQQFQISQVPSYSNTDTSHVTSGTLTPQTRSRPASPTGLPGPQQKKRKASGSGRMLEQLRMTPMQNPQTHNPPSPGYPFSNVPNGAPFSSRRPVHNQINRSTRFSNSHVMGCYRTNPSSPNHSGFRTFTEANRSQSMENFSAPMFSAPSSAHQSRAHSPKSEAHGNSTNFQPDLAQALDNSLRNVQVTDAYAQPRPTSQPRSQPTVQPHQGTLPPSPFQPQAMSQISSQPQIEEMAPDTGLIEGGTLCVFIGTGFHSDLQVFFGDRRATSVRSRAGVTLSCRVPPGERPGLVPIRFEHWNPQQLPSPGAEPTHFYRYVNEEWQKSAPQTLQNQSQSQSSENLFDYSQAFQQYANENTMSQYSQQPTLPHHAYTPSVGQGFTETPPAYCEVLAEDDKRILDIKTRSTLRAVGDALMDQKATEAFETTATEVESSKVMRRVTICNDAISQEEREKLRAGRNRKVKGLRSDRKLWSVWVPILILVMIAMLYDRFPQIWHVAVLTFAWIRDTIFPQVSRATSWGFGFIHRRMQHDQVRVMEVG